MSVGCQANTAMGGSSPGPELAVNGDASSFNLCSSGAGGQNSVVYKPQAGQGYVLSSCYPVRLYMIGLQQQ